mgnify:CR=1 FL=1
MEGLGINLPSSSISDGIRDACIRPDIDPTLAAVTVIDSVRALQQHLLLRSRVMVELKQDKPTRMIDELVRYLLKGIAAS